VATSASRTAVLGTALAIFAFAALAVTSKGGLRTVFAVGVCVTVIYAGTGILTSSTNKGSFDRYESISNPGKAVSTYFDYRKETLAKIPQYMVRFPLGSGIGRNGPGASYPGGPGRGYDAESEPTFLLIEVGIPGLVVIFGLYIALMYLSVTRIRRIADKEARILLTALAAPLFAIFAVGFVGITTAGTPNAPYLWFVAGTLAFWLLGDGYRRLKQTGQIAAPGTVPPPPTPHLSGAHAA
jgi:O-antigen ligase